MYDEIVRRLRNGLSCYGERCLSCPDKKHCTTKYQQEAADAIEELAAFKAQITNGHMYCMRDGILYEAKLNPPKAKSIKLPPIKFAEPPKEE